MYTLREAEEVSYNLHACPFVQDGVGHRHRDYGNVKKSTLDDILSNMVSRICQVGDPEKIILFGSQARGDAKASSDIDLLIVEKSTLPRYKRPTRYRKAVAGLFIAKDIVVWSPEEINEWSNVPNAFITTIVREGRVLYEA